MNSVAEEMPQYVKELVAPVEDSNSIPSTDNGWLTTACKRSSRRTDSLFWPPQPPKLHIYIHKKVNILEMNLLVSITGNIPEKSSILTIREVLLQEYKNLPTLVINLLIPTPTLVLENYDFK